MVQIWEKSLLNNRQDKMEKKTSFKECFTIDLSKWRPEFRTKNYIQHFFFDSGYFAVLCYRLDHYFLFKKFKPIHKGIPFLPSLFSRLSIALSGCEINYNAEIDEGLLINHSPGIVIGAKVKIGKKVKIFSGVTIGAKNLKPYELNANNRYPVIENNVVIFTGAKILGPITIGNGAIIGANSVVIDSVPENATVAGIPAKIISRGE